ncbi:MAG: VanW family protein [Schwartzia sp.]|nr:VanW family protein [Schwartzia sp. (in: firmicutes)]
MKPLRPMLIFTSLLAVTAFLLSVAFLGLVLGFIRQDLTAFGLKTGTYPLSGLTREEAAAQFGKRAAETFRGPAVIASYGEQTFEAGAAEVGLSADIEAATDAAYRVGREPNLAARALSIARSALRGGDIPLTARLDEKKLETWLAGLAAKIDTAPKDAQLLWSGTRAQVTPGVTGRKLDTASLAKTLAPALLAFDLPQRLTLTVAEEPPKVTDSELRPIDSELASYTTYYDPSSSRGQNIEIATATLDGLVVRSGEEVSFNTVVGGRVAGAGYQTAPVIVNGKVEQDIGGGVCQVSSTLYNAILLANLTPTQRTSHFFPSGYVPAGLDATVADGQIDFCFRNTLPHAVYILASAGGGTLTFTVLGHGADVPDDIDMETVIKDPRPIVDVWRVYYRNGAETDREFLHTDEYDIPEEHQEPSPATAPSSAADPAPTDPVPDTNQTSTPDPPPAPVPAPTPSQTSGPTPTLTQSSNPSPAPVR